MTDERTIGDILTEWRQRLEILAEKGSKRTRDFAESLEPQIQELRAQSREQASRVEKEVRGTWKRAQEEEHLGYTMLTSGYRAVQGGARKVLAAKPDMGLRQAASYAAEIAGGAFVAALGVPVYLAEEGARALLRKKKTN